MNGKTTMNMKKILLSLATALFSLPAFATNSFNILDTPPPATSATVLTNGTATPAGGLVADSLANLFAYSVSVLSQNASAGDNSTDASTAINNAITVACAASPHKAVFFPAGNYKIKAATINVTCAPLELYGAPGAVIIADTLNTQSPVLLKINNQTAGQIKIHDLIFDGNANGICPTNLAHDVGIFQSSYVDFYGNTFKNSCRVAVQFSTNIKYSGMRNNKFKNISMYWHVTADPTDGRVAVNFQDVGTGWASTKTGASFGNYFTEHNVVETYGYDGIQAVFQSNMLISGNVFSPGVGNQTFSAGVGNACIFGYGDWMFNIDNNLCINQSGNAIDVAGNAQATITNNNIYSSGVHGIGVSTGRIYGIVGGEVGGVITGNHIRNSGLSATGEGISLYQGTSGSGDQNITGVTIAGNDLTDDQGTPTQQYGIGISSGAPTISQIVIGINRYNGNALGDVDPALAAYMTLTCSQLPALTGVITTSSGTCATGYASSTGSGAAVLAASPSLTGTVNIAGLIQTGQLINSLNGAASTPPINITGTWFSGGTATTTKPQVLVECSGATSNNWNGNGTGIGVNACSGFAGTLLNLQLNGADRFRINAAGLATGVGGLTITGAAINLNASSNFAVNIGTGTSNAGVNIAGSSNTLGFFAATAVAQPGATVDLGTALSNLGLRAAGTAYPITTSGAVNLTGGLVFNGTDVAITDPQWSISSAGAASFTSIAGTTGIYNGLVTLGSASAATGNTGELGFAKITASGSAPGAGYCKQEYVCGTNAGTAKEISYCGTSTTPVTIVDNIGSGVTGC